MFYPTQWMHESFRYALVGQAATLRLWEEYWRAVGWVTNGIEPTKNEPFDAAVELPPPAMFVHDPVTEGHKNDAKINGYTAGRSGDTTEPPQFYRGSTILLVCWYWGFSQGEKDKIND